MSPWTLCVCVLCMVLVYVCVYVHAVIARSCMCCIICLLPADVDTDVIEL